MRATLALLGALVLTTPAAGALSVLGIGVTPDASAGEVIVGYREGTLDAARAAILGLGATILETDEDLRILVVQSRGITGFLTTILSAPAVEYAETNDATHMDGAQWNGAQWNGAQWNGAQWNWNGTDDAGLDSGTALQWGLDASRAKAAWNTSAGQRAAKLCVLDSGVSHTHPDVKGNLWTGADGSHGYNAISPNVSDADDGGHGTHVAGIAAAANDNGYGVSGVGNVRIMSVKVLDATGNGREDDLAMGIAWCASHGADVALMALSVDKDGPTLRRAIAYATQRDVLLVASAGNGGCQDCVSYPARDPHVIAVAALAKDGTRAPFSSRGPEIDISAPGVGILGPLPDGSFSYGSGTSQAAAFVAGAAALVRDAHPDLTAAQTRALLGSTARDLGSPHSFGKGALDVEAAMAEG